MNTAQLEPKRTLFNKILSQMSRLVYLYRRLHQELFIRILVKIGHPAHIHYFKNSIPNAIVVIHDIYIQIILFSKG